MKTIRAVQGTQRLQDISIIMQRFAHAHKNKVGYMVNGCAAGQTCRRPGYSTQLSCKVENLCDDLARAQMAVKAHLPRRAKRTAKGAACLCRDTDSSTRTALAQWRVEHQHRFDQFAVCQFQ